MILNIISIILQITSTDSVQIAADAGSQELSVLDLIFKGGYVMIPIFILSVIAIYIFVERFLYINQAGKLDPYFFSTVKEKLKQGDVKAAIDYCAGHPYPIARMLEKALYRLGSSMRDIESAIENTANVQISKMERNLGILAAIAAIAPMMGFLGTVTGMIKAFHNIALSDNISIGIIAGGIYEKMITSAAGLIVGIVAYMLYTILNNKIDKTIGTMEMVTTDFLDILYKPVI